MQHVPFVVLVHEDAEVRKLLKEGADYIKIVASGGSTRTSDPNRASYTVGELAAPYDMSLAAVSKHLKVLETAGLISRGREAQWRPCHLEAAPLRASTEWLEDYRRFWDRNLDSLGLYLKAIQKKPRKRKTR